MDAASHIYFRWIGIEAADEAILEVLRIDTESVFGIPARIMQSSERPTHSFDPSRNQYSSTTILRWVLQQIPADASKVVAVTDADLFIPVLTFVFGEAQLGGKAAVVSTARLRVDLNNLPCPPQRFRSRIVKECVHELGHTFGLIHCGLSRCVMSRSNSVPEVDTKLGNFCRDCRAMLNRFQQSQR